MAVTEDKSICDRW